MEFDAALGADEAGQPSLRRALGAFALTMVGMSTVIGVGIFVFSGVTAAQFTGPALTLSFLMAAGGLAIIALCYAELAATIPAAGSSYTYVAQSMGRFPGWLVAWAMVLEYLVSVSTIAVGWSGYLVGLAGQYGITIPARLVTAPMTLSDNFDFAWTGAWGNLPAALFTLAMTGILALGIRESAGFNNVIAMMKIGVIILVIVFGAPYVKPANWHPFIPPNDGTWGHFGWSGVLRGTALAFWVYSGFETITCCAQEARKPSRDLPLAIIATLLISMVLYVAVSLVLTGLVQTSKLNVSDPVLVALQSVGSRLDWLVTVVSVGALIGISSSLLASLYGQIRIFYVMACDGLLPMRFATVHPRFRTPLMATWVTGGACALVAMLLPLDVLTELISMGTLLAFASVCVAVPVLRFRQPDRQRPFKIWGSPIVPAMGLLICLGLMASMPVRSYIQLLGWMAIGAVIFLLYRRRR